MTMPRPTESTAAPSCLLLAFELGEKTWKLGFTVGAGQRPRVRQVPAGSLASVWKEIAEAKRRFKCADATPVISCYEAGRDGFWVHRAVVAHGVTNYVVDSASIEVNRRARRAKSDGLDLGGLLTLLARYLAGDTRCWHVVRVPSDQEEDARHRHRSREALQQDRTRLLNRLQGLLATAGVRVPVTRDFLAQIETARRWDATPLPAGLRTRLTETWQQLAFLTTQLAALEQTLVPDATTPAGQTAGRLQTLRAIGPVGATVLTTEIFSWRQIRHGRELGALVGLVPAVYQSGETAHDQGITRAGNRHVRRVMVQLAWSWLRFQPTSALSDWYQRRFGEGGPRARRIGIVALARKLLIALWRYVDHGVLPAGAALKG